MDDTGQCSLCSEAIDGCSTCNSATVCTACSIDGLTTNADGSACICDVSNRPNAILDESTGFCSCADGYHLHPTLGCSTCEYLIPGCRECAETSTDTGISLDHYRMAGPSASENYLTCSTCDDQGRFVNTGSSSGVVRCEACQVAFDGCTACENDGSTCSQCASTHVREISAAGDFT